MEPSGLCPRFVAHMSWLSLLNRFHANHDVTTSCVCSTKSSGRGQKQHEHASQCAGIYGTFLHRFICSADHRKHSRNRYRPKRRRHSGCRRYCPAGRNGPVARDTVPPIATGIYVLLELPIGHYRLQVAAKGFQVDVQNGITLNVNDTVSVLTTLGWDYGEGANIGECCMPRAH